MTDLTPEELRAACEVAGLVPFGSHDVDDATCWEYAERGWMILDDDPALPAYVAPLLVARVREMTHEVCTIDGAPTCDMTRVIIRTDPAAPGWVTLAEVSGRNAHTQRIRAAMEALNNEA